MPELVVWFIVAVAGIALVALILALLETTVTAVVRCPNCGDDPQGYTHEPVDRGICRLVLPKRYTRA